MTARERAPLRFPRFGLRTLLVAGVVASLLFGWIGKRVYELRRDEAAIEALNGCSGGIVIGADPLQWEPESAESPLAAFDDSGANWERVRIVLGLSSRPRLRSAVLSLYDADDERMRPALDALRRFPELEEVGFVGRGFDDSAIEAAAELPRLEALWLNGTSVTGAGLALLEGRERLQTFHNHAAFPPDDFVQGLAQLKTLRIVGYSGDTHVDRANLEALASLPKLEELRLYDVTLSDEADLLLPLEQAGSLKVLTIVATGSGGDIGRSPYLSKLEDLALFGVDDATVMTWPVTPSLKEAQFRFPVTPEAVAAFSAAHPTCDVHYVQGNLTGITYRGGEPLR